MADKVLAPETRTVAVPIELREADAAAPMLVGYASVFGQQYDMGTFSERVDPSAFDKTLGTNPDVRLLIDHDGQPLARTKSGTLRLSTDDVGLRVEATLDPSDPDVQRLLPKMRRGDLDQMSFAFRVPAGGDEWTPDYSLRTLREINMQGGDVSVVTYPASPTTSAALRSLDVVSGATALVDAVMRETRSTGVMSASGLAAVVAALNTMDGLDVQALLDEARDSTHTEAPGLPLRLAQARLTALGIAG